jgi:multisubunit Na+/H+ antiporter MnhB subunit
MGIEIIGGVVVGVIAALVLFSRMRKRPRP